MARKKLRVLVLGGGPSSEHEISLETAEMVAKHLDHKKYEPILATVDRYGKWPMPKNVDLAFIAMHGEFGEDGKIQAILETAGIPYTGSGVLASALGMDKIKSQALFKSQGFNVPESFFFKRAEYIKNKNKILKEIKNKFDLPIVIKPSDRGSSVGAGISQKLENLENTIKIAASVSSNLLAQEFIKGTELACGVLDDGKNNLMPLLPTEIVPKMGEFFNYKSKYSESGSDEITPARVPAEILKEAQNIAIKTHVLVGCSGFSRTDMIWSKERRKIYTLEINTIPGLTEQSILPKAAAVCGIPFPKLLGHIIKSALVKNV